MVTTLIPPQKAPPTLGTPRRLTSLLAESGGANLCYPARPCGRCGGRGSGFTGAGGLRGEGGVPPARLRPPSPAPNRGEVWGPCSQPGRGPARPSGLGCQEGGPRRSRAGSGRGGRGAGAPRPRLRRALLRGGIIEPRGRGPALAAEARLELGARAARVPRPEPRAAPRAPRLCPPAARRPPPMERAAPSRRVPLPLLLLGGLSLLAAQGRGAGARRGGRERPEPTAPALVTPRHPDRPDPRPVRLLELPAPGSVDRRCAPPRSSRCLCCAAARPRRRSRQPPTRLLASVPITSLTWEFVLKTDGSLQTHPPAGPLASTLPTLAPTHPLGPGCGLGERKAGWWLPRTPPHTPYTTPCLLLAPGAPLAYLFPLPPPPPLRRRCGTQLAGQWGR